MKPTDQAKASCLLCGNDDTILKTTEYKGYLEPDFFSIYHCSHCNTAFSMPRVDTSRIYDLIYHNKAETYTVLERFYEEVKKEKYPIRYLIAEGGPTFWSVYYAIRKMVKASKKSNIIEIGSGLGYLTYALRKKGYNIIGLDISKEAVDNACSSFGDYYKCADVFDYSEEHKEVADVIILTEVIEHVENPIAFTKALVKILRKGGHIIMTSPNKSYYSPDIVWASDIPPVHCWWFSEDSMKYIARELNLSISFLDYSNSWQIRMSKPKVDIVDHVDAVNEWVFFKDGTPIKRNNQTNSLKKGFIPATLKKTTIYRIFSQTFFPIISKLYSPQKRHGAFCVVFEK